MRSFSAAALLTLAIVTECLGAHSDRPRQRSGPIRSVPIAADIKRDVNFDCPEEFGYYPHPTDCTLYYVCVFGGALLESCTGGLMYSHELQTCDWPRNVGCDGTSAAGGDELERLSERDPPPPPPPRRTPPPPPPPPPRAQPNPVVTSRGQPKFNREEYEKQQQLYAEVDDLPPVEEIESDRQQRVYRGQPSTIGQVQKDRDGYSAQIVSARTINSNIIPASIPQTSGKIGSFSFGTQVDERRIATATQAPQTYSENRNDNVTDSSYDRQKDIDTNETDAHDVTKLTIRRKRDVIRSIIGFGESNFTDADEMSDRSNSDKVIKYISADSEAGQDNEDDDDDDDDDDENDDENTQYDSERGKRQVRYYLKNGYKNPGKIWVSPKPIKFVDIQQFNYNPSTQSIRYQPMSNILSGNQFHDATRKPLPGNYLYSTANPYALYQTENTQSQKPFKASFPDPFSQQSLHTPMNVATQIITKSPPISALKNNENPFLALGGFFNNSPKQSNVNSHQNQNTNQYSAQKVLPLNHPINHVSFQDSSLLPSTVVTGKPIRMSTLRTRPKHPLNLIKHANNQLQKELNNAHQNITVDQRQVNNGPDDVEQDDDDEEDDEDEDEESSEENTDKDENDDNYYSHDFPDPPYEFTHPTNKYADIENPFANPNFDFDTFIAKLKQNSDDYDEVNSKQPKTKQQNIAVRIINPPTESTAVLNTNSGVRLSTLSYNSMSTPRPFSVPTDSEGVTKPNQVNINSPSTTRKPEKFQNLVQLYANQQSYGQQQDQQSFKDNSYNRNPQQYANIPLGAVRPNLKPPNFKDDRQLPISYSFDRPISSTPKSNNDKTKGETKQIFTITQKPYIVVTSTGRPMIFSTPKFQNLVKPEKIITLHPHLFATAKPYFISSAKPHNAYITFKQSTSKPLTTLANEQLSALQHYWRNPSTEPQFYIQSTVRPSTVSEIPKLESLFAQAITSTTPVPTKSQNVLATTKDPVTTSTKSTPKRRPIPKPSPEMNDYYYDDEDEQYYYEPPVKSKYMPSTEVKPQRPPMAQNYQEYEDFHDSVESPGNNKPLHTTFRRPIKNKQESATQNHNDVSIVTKAPLKDFNKHINGKLIPVLVDYGTPAPNVLTRPEISNYEIIHLSPRNRTLHLKRPIYQGSSPYTRKPPKYLNQTTLRPYTVRHRLAKPTTVKYPFAQGEDNKQTRGRTRHPNIVAQMKLTTPRDNHNQETRYTKTKHDDKTNSLEPTESVTPSSYASPRPKMLYNGSQNYSPDHYDPFYAVYDEDGELYKDTDYVQQYNTASLRPAVQQTYRGTPPPARRPVEAYTPRPSQDDYDDALIHGQINNQNQYQSAIRHSTRGEGNELGYDHIPSSVKTTIYEATPISTTPTTSTSTTTQRSTTAPFTEAMTPSRYTPRSSTDENPSSDTLSKNPSDGSAFSVPSSPIPEINFSTFAKPFQKTENSHRLRETLILTEELQTPGPTFSVTNKTNNNLPVEVVRSTNNQDKRKVVSLTSGFSIRRNTNNTSNPYTLTVLTRPFDSYNKQQIPNATEYKNNIEESNTYYENDKEGQEESIEKYKEIDFQIDGQSSDSSMRRNDGSSEVESEEELPIYVRPSRTKTNSRSNFKVAPTPPSTSTTKYYLKTVIKRPAPNKENNERKTDSTENIINTGNLETGLRNTKSKEYISLQDTSATSDFPKWNQYSQTEGSWNNPAVSPYRTLNNLRNSYHREKDFIQDFTTTTSSTTRLTTPKAIKQNKRIEEITSSKPLYYSYRILDDEVPDQTTEVFSATVKNIIKAFFNNLGSTPKPQQTHQYITPRTTHRLEEETVNIGYQKKKSKYVDEKPFKNNVKHVEILTEPTVNRFISPNLDTVNNTEKDRQLNKDFSSTTATFIKTTSASANIPQTTPLIPETSPYNEFRTVPSRQSFISKFNNLITDKPESSQKFHNIISGQPSTERNYLDKSPNNDLENEVTKLTKTNLEASKTTTENEWNKLTNKIVSDIATTTGTTKSTSTLKVEPTSTTKSLSFPTRASRVNPAIKLAATNPGGGRRSYQSSSKCSSDNSLQANPKCNEIKYQRPSSTRGRGSAHYSTLSGSDTPQQQTSNRGTPPTRSRPTLKPSTAVVTNTNPIVDIYANPPRRPAPVYPQPTPDKTAAKCRKDVCLLPDCYCGGKDIPGDLPVESVPQIVLLTFDDSVNDLNKGLYADLFEKGRVNPNGCPISATFYVSHEWTDYSQVQNLYSAGHEMASHTVSHSFGEQFSQKKWNREVGGQREILAAYGGVKLEDVRGMRAPFLSVGGNKMFKMLYDSNFTYDSSLPVYENRPPSWPYTLDYKLFHDCMIPPCPTKSYPGVWEVPMVMWQDLNGGRCSMGDACANPPEAEGVYKMLLKNFDRHYTTNRAPFGLYYHAAWFTQPHHKEGFIMFLDFINQMSDVWIVTNWQALQWVRDPTPISRLNNFQPFQCNYQDRPKKCNNPKVCNLWHKSGVRYMRTCQPCPEIYPWTGKTGIRSSRIDNDIEE